jgi:hypothetical protein
LEAVPFQTTLLGIGNDLRPDRDSNAGPTA